MIQDEDHILINAKPETVFEFIETMPNKFPVHKILDRTPFLFLRILLVDGFRSAMDAVRVEKPKDIFVLQLGESMGPFRLTEFQRPLKYQFTLKSFFFNCQTGYTLNQNGNGTTLTFDLIADNPTPREDAWWFFVKPIHGILARKVLKVIKEKVESI